MSMQTTTDDKLSASMEDYLEAILMLVRRSRVARVRDIAAHLHVGMPSVTSALKSLAKRGLVNYDPYQFVTLTDRGQESAEGISQRHDVLRRFLVDVLGMTADSAESNACRMEHAVDQEFLDHLRKFTDFVLQCPRTGQNWLDALARHCAAGADARECNACRDKSGSPAKEVSQ